MQITALNLVGSVLYHKTPAAIKELSIREDFLFDDLEREVYQFTKDYYLEYGVLPTIDLVQEKCDVVLPESHDAPAFYSDELKNRYLQRKVWASIKAANDKLNEDKPQEALTHLVSDTAKLISVQHDETLVDYRESKGLILENYKKTAFGHQTGISLGWETFDGMSNGLMPGDLMSVVGRPAQGKSIFSLYMTRTAWLKQHKPILYVSMEMTHQAVFERLVAMDASLPLKDVKKAELTTPQLQKMKARLVEVSAFDTPYWVLHGNLGATLEQIWMMARQLQPGMIFIDGAYLLGSSDPRANRFERVAENTRLMKSELCTNLGIPTAASWQFNRQAAKKAKGGKEEAGLEDIGFSDEIGQLSSFVLGLMQPHSVETLNSRRIDILKGRNGESGQFDVNWDFHNMDFSEAVEESELDYNFM